MQCLETLWGYQVLFLGSIRPNGNISKQACAIKVLMSHFIGFRCLPVTILVYQMPKMQKNYVSQWWKMLSGRWRIIAGARAPRGSVPISCKVATSIHLSKSVTFYALFSFPYFISPYYHWIEGIILAQFVVLFSVLFKFWMYFYFKVWRFSSIFSFKSKIGYWI